MVVIASFQIFDNDYGCIQMKLKFKEWCKSLWLTQAHQSFPQSKWNSYFWYHTQRDNNRVNSKVYCLKFQSISCALEQSNP